MQENEKRTLLEVVKDNKKKLITIGLIVGGVGLGALVVKLAANQAAKSALEAAADVVGEAIENSTVVDTMGDVVNTVAV